MSAGQRVEVNPVRQPDRVQGSNTTPTVDHANFTMMHEWLQAAPFNDQIRSGSRYCIVPRLTWSNATGKWVKRSDVVAMWGSLGSVYVHTTQAGYYCRLVGVSSKMLSIHPIGDITTYSIEWNDLQMVCELEPVKATSDTASEVSDHPARPASATIATVERAVTP